MVRTPSFVVALVACLVVGAAVYAQGPKSTPARLLNAKGFVPDEAFVTKPLPGSEQAYADISGTHLKALIGEVTAISEKDRARGEKMWGRIAGFPGEKDTNDWVEAKFKALGLENVHRQAFNLPPQWMPKSWDVSFTGGGKTIVAKSLLPAPGSPSTPAGGLDLEAVWVGTGTAADFVGRNVRGKAVFIHDIPTPGTINHSVTWTGSIRRAQEQGAAAIFVVYGISDNWAIWQGLGGGDAGADAASRAPGFYMGYQDGSAVRDLIGTGQPVRAKISLAVENANGLTATNVYGTLPGTSDENVLILAHQDGYFDAALDNASGLAGLIGLAEHFSKVPRAQRKRSITFVGTAGHHAGSPGTRWMHDNRDTYFAKTALAINLEHLSYDDTANWGATIRKSNAISPRRWWVFGSPKLVDVVTSSFLTFGVPLLVDMDNNASGDMGNMARDLPSMQTIDSPEVKHADADTADWIPAPGIEALVRSYAKIVDEVNKLTKGDLELKN
jgi:hypothetical protein